MGALLSLWATDASPHGDLIEQTVTALRGSKVALDHAAHCIELSAQTMLSLDAIAKGYIVDHALSAARRAAPGVAGLAVSIGGDIRCYGKSPNRCGWMVGIPDPSIAVDNAPLVDAIVLMNAAIATSGRGPRDCTPGGYRSTTISPLTGYPVRDVISASVVASHAADADALATACLVLPPDKGLVLVDKFDGAAARITAVNGEVHLSAGWSALRLAAPAAPTAAAKKTTPTKQAPAKEAPKIPHSPVSPAPTLPSAVRWPNDWELGVNYAAPERQEERSADFRIPYMALWITDAQNRPVRTLLMVGRGVEWHRDNFIWWGMQRTRAAELVDLRSQSTTISGRYQVYWDGMTDDWQPVPLGKYVLHMETNQERGKHYYRSLNIELGRERFKTQLPSLPESGGMVITYGHYNDRFKSDE
jgi:thiamine biosynthesis lipoprotein